MARFLHPDSFLTFRKYGRIILALSGVAGFSLGFFLYCSVGFSDISWMYAAFCRRVSIVDLLIPFIRPFSISVFTVYMNYSHLLPGICFLKSTAYSFVSCLTLDLFGSAGWIMRLLAMFSGICHMVLLYWYWFRHCSDTRLFSYAETAVIVFMAVLIIGFDFLFVLPILGDILNF